MQNNLETAEQLENEELRYSIIQNDILYSIFSLSISSVYSNEEKKRYKYNCISSISPSAEIYSILDNDTEAQYAMLSDNYLQKNNIAKNLYRNNKTVIDKFVKQL